MCNSRYYDLFSVAASLLSGIVFTLLVFFNLVTAFIEGPWLALGLGVFALGVLTIASTSLLRQDERMNACVCGKGKRLLFPAMILTALSAFTLVFALTNLLISLILAFILSTLFVYTLFRLYCFLSCIVQSGGQRRCDC